MFLIQHLDNGVHCAHETIIFLGMVSHWDVREIGLLESVALPVLPLSMPVPQRLCMCTKLVCVCVCVGGGGGGGVKNNGTGMVSN